MHPVPKHNPLPLRQTPPRTNAERWLTDLLLFAALHRPTALTLRKGRDVIRVEVIPSPSPGTTRVTPLAVVATGALGDLLAERVDLTESVLPFGDVRKGTIGSFSHVIHELRMIVTIGYEPSTDPYVHLRSLQLTFNYQQAA